MAKKRKRKSYESPMRLIRQSVEFCAKDEWPIVPPYIRGIYVLYYDHSSGRKKTFDVVYVGMARVGIRGRLAAHARNKADLWTHFSLFEVWENVRDREIEELEGLLRHIYRRDARANSLNTQKLYGRARSVRAKTITDLTPPRTKTKP